MARRALTESPGSSQRRRMAVGLFALGLPGLLSLLLVYSVHGGPPPLGILVAPAILLAAAAFAGAWTAPSAGFVSRVAARAGGTRLPILPVSWWQPFILGIALGFAIALVDHATRSLWQAQQALPPSLVEAWSPASLVLGVLYGGVIEEIMMRWGLTSVLAVLLWKVFDRDGAKPSPSFVWAAITLAALVFAASHLPGLIAGGVPVEGPLLFRTLLWNGLLGVVFGAFFVHCDLESAMLCHAGFHVGLAPAAFLIATL